MDEIIELSLFSLKTTPHKVLELKLESCMLKPLRKINNFQTFLKILFCLWKMFHYSLTQRETFEFLKTCITSIDFKESTTPNEVQDLSDIRFFKTNNILSGKNIPLINEIDTI